MVNRLRLHVRSGLQTAALLCVIITIAACTPQRNVRKPVADPAATAVAQMHVGNYTGAAEEYQRLASAATGVQAIRYWLNAASAWLQGAELASIEQALANVPSAGLPAELSTWNKLLRAAAALHSDNAVVALRQLQSIPSAVLPPARQREFHHIRAMAFIDTRQPLEEVYERAKLDDLLTAGTERVDNNRRLWEALQEVPPAALARQRPSAESALGGWYELTALVQNRIHQPALFGRDLDAWQQRYPQHPAQQEIAAELRELSEDIAVRPRSIALLLPFGSKFGEAAAAIREGFVHAWYADSENASRPSLRFYNANTANVDSVYPLAISEGAELVVGPLQKDAVDVLADGRELRVPTLALNHLSPRAPDSPRLDRHLFQFGLPPEDEAQQVAERAWLEGFERAVCVTPENAWGERVQAAFAKHWRALGGDVLEHVTYPPATRDYAAPIKELLNITGSVQRARELNAIVGQKVDTEPRRRMDIDFVFMAAFPTQARQIRPQLEFFHAVNVPVFTTSHVFSGTIDSQADQDMNGVTLGDMPWILDADRAAFSALRELAATWPAQANRFRRLHALGADAYRLIPHLARLRIQRFARFQGATGELRIVNEGEVRRQLQWARFENGVPQLRGRPAKE